MTDRYKKHVNQLNMQTVRDFKDGGWNLQKYHVTMTYIGYPE